MLSYTTYGRNNGDIHKSLKYCIQNFKTSLKIMKIQNIFYETNLKAERKVHGAWIIPFYSKDIPTSNELVIENTLVKR